MSIVIERLPGGNFLGVCTYSITQDGKQLTTFEHDRSDDLRVCLEKAAASIDRGRWEQSCEVFSKYGGG